MEKPMLQPIQKPTPTPQQLAAREASTVRVPAYQARDAAEASTVRMVRATR
jgi:hypothetical protein